MHVNSQSAQYDFFDLEELSKKRLITPSAGDFNLACEFSSLFKWRMASYRYILLFANWIQPDA